MILLLTIKNLYKTFNTNTVNENKLFNGLSIDIEDNEFVTIIGSNGAGKSSLLNIISGTLEHDNGEICLNDMDISNMPEYKRTRVIGRVFQDPSMGVSPTMTILENLSMAYNKSKKFNLTMGISNKNTDYFIEVLSKLSLGLEEKLNEKVGLLSGGQRQALSLIMATISNPSLLLLDEHIAALDPKTSEIIIELSNSLITEKKITTLMVTHNLNHAISLGNRLIMLHKGKIMLDIKGEEKKNMTIEKLLDYFEKNRKGDFLSDRILFSN